MNLRNLDTQIIKILIIVFAFRYNLTDVLLKNKFLRLKPILENKPDSIESESDELSKGKTLL